MAEETLTWHAGEREVQARAGRRADADAVAGIVGSEVTPAAAAFLSQRELVVVASTDAAGAVWISPLTGPPGFARALSADTITVDTASLAVDDPLAAALAGRAGVGMLAVDLATRRRARFNGHSTAVGGGLRIDVDQAYSNCPKYIQRRTITGRAPTAAGAATAGTALDARQQAWVGTADTLFIGTTDSEGNADASHRGGSPGFVEVLDANHLRFPDYAGNAMFMTLGNLAVQPHAGLLFLDWDSGATLQLAGRAVTRFGTARWVDVLVEQVIERAGALPLAWGPPEPSRYNPPLSG
jgi:predicted pyridoxine 5'-phosphate oxidase superfamily flavin-nucleotide-binding protein